MFKRKIIIPTLIFAFLLFPATFVIPSGTTDILKNLIQKQDKNYIYDIIHFDIEAVQESDRLDITTKMKFKMTNTTKNQFAFFIASGCKIYNVTEISTEKTIPFKMKTDFIMNSLYFQSDTINDTEQYWEFKYSCGPQKIFEDDLAWFGHEGIQIGMLSWYPVNALENNFTYNLKVKTLDGFIAAANGLLEQYSGKNVYNYQGQNNQIFLFIKKYKIVRKHKGNIDYLFFIGHTTEPKLGYDRIVDIADYILNLYSALLTPYKKKYFTIVETVKPGGSSNWGVGDTIFIIPDYWESDETDFLGIIGHESAHTWFGKLLHNDMRGLAGFVETLANTFQIIARERNPFINPESGIPLFWEKKYSTYVQDLDKKGLKEISILKAKYNLPDTIMQHYIKGAMIIRMFRYKVGDEVFFRIMKTFTEKNRDGFCSFESFVEIAREISGDEVAKLLLRWFGEIKRMDYALTKAIETKESGRYKTLVTIENKADESLSAPLEVLFTMKKDGNQERDIVKVDLTDPITNYEYESDYEVDSISIDPNQWLVDSVWDNNWKNKEDIEWK